VTLQTNSGPQSFANYAVTRAQVGSVVQFVNPARATFSGGSATVPFVEPGTLFGDRMWQLDLRVAQAIRYPRVRAGLTLDLANMLNGNAVLVENTTYGSRRRQPGFVLQGRIMKPGTRWSSDGDRSDGTRTTLKRGLSHRLHGTASSLTAADTNTVR
jgi:hypothetical protein